VRQPSEPESGKGAAGDSRRKENSGERDVKQADKGQRSCHEAMKWPLLTAEMMNAM